MSDEDWRSEERYARLGALSPAELAWEFLRRNPDYQKAFRTWIEVGSAGTQGAEDAPWSRWGLSFPGGSGALSL